MEKNNRSSALSREQIELLQSRLKDPNYVKHAIDKIAENMTTFFTESNPPKDKS